VTVYLDTSAAAKLLVDEPESDALARHLDRVDPDEMLASNALLETELRRVAVRLDLAQASVSEVLARVALVDPDRSLFHEAGLLPGAMLRSLDALHLATALRLGAFVVAYDARLVASATALGLDVVSPR
jgi:uncharacterized protein